MLGGNLSSEPSAPRPGAPNHAHEAGHGVFKTRGAAGWFAYSPNSMFTSLLRVWTLTVFLSGSQVTSQ